MLKDAIGSMFSAFRKIFTHWGATLISFILYAVLIAVLYFLITTREATTLQVVLSVAVLPIAALIVFFVMQALALSFVRIGVGPGYLLKRAFKDCWKLMVISIPVIVIAGLVIHYAGRLEVYLTSDFYKTGSHLKLSVFTWARAIVLYFMLPLIAVQLWISTMREGIAPALRGFLRSLIRAFSPSSVLIYATVSLVFGAIAWLLLFTKTAVASPWVELWLLGSRLAVALLVIFLGWQLILGSMAEMTTARALKDDLSDISQS